METEKAEKRLEAAKKREEAARLRVLAASQRDGVSAYMRQAGMPIYSGQEIICIGKAGQFEAYAARNISIANRLDAEADLLDCE